MKMSYVVTISYPFDSQDLAFFIDMHAAIEFAKSIKLGRSESLEFRNNDCCDLEGPMWDGEDVVSNWSDGLTDDEEELLYVAGLR